MQTPRYLDPCVPRAPHAAGLSPLLYPIPRPFTSPIFQFPCTILVFACTVLTPNAMLPPASTLSLVLPLRSPMFYSETHFLLLPYCSNLCLCFILYSVSFLFYFPSSLTLPYPQLSYTVTLTLPTSLPFLPFLLPFQRMSLPPSSLSRVLPCPAVPAVPCRALPSPLHQYTLLILIKDETCY